MKTRILNLNRASSLRLAALSAVAAAALPAGAASFTWLGTSTTWNAGTTWTGDAAGYPNAAGAIASVTSDITSNTIITLNEAITIGALTLGDANTGNTYTIATGSAAGALTFDNSGSTAQITILSTSKGDTISANVGLTSNLLLTQNSANALVMSGTISGAGNLTKTGIGALTLSATNNYTGDSAVLGGTVTVNNASAFGNATTAILLGDTSGSTNAALSLGTNLGRNLTLQSGNAGFVTLAVGSKTSSGTITLGSANGAGHGVILNGNGGVVSGLIQDPVGLQAGTAGLVTINNGGGLLYFGNAASTFSGGVTLNAGSLSFAATGSSTALGTGTFTINGGSFNQVGSQAIVNRFSTMVLNNDLSTGNVYLYFRPAKIDLGATGTSTTRIVNAGTLTFLGGTISDGSNGVTKSLTKTGGSTLTLEGTNNYTGGTIINAGVLQFNNAVPTSGLITINAGGALNASASYATLQGWLDGGKIAIGSAGSLALTGNNSQNVNFSTSGYNNLMLGASAAATYTGTITPANGTYRLGGGGSTLTLSNVNALTGTNVLVVGAPGSAGTVSLSNANNYSGATTVVAGTLNLTGTAGAVVNSDVTVNGATFSLSSGTAASVTRAKSVTLNAGIFTIASSTVANTSDVITGDLTLKSGYSTITLNSNTSKTAQLTAANLVHNAGQGVALVNGVNLGKDLVSTATVGRMIFTTAPTLIGTTDAATTGINALAKDTKIVPFLVGEATSTAGGLGTASGTANTFLTYNATTGLRPLNPSDEFTTNTITVNNNTRITASTAVATNTSINSLVMAITGTGLYIADGATLTDTSGALLFVNSGTIRPAGTTGALSFGSAEGVITSNSGVSALISTAVDGTGGIVKSGAGALTLSGSNSFSGGLSVQGGTLTLSNTNNTYTGATRVLDGTLSLTGNVTNGSGALGASTSDVLLGDTSGFANTTLKTSTTFARNITVQAGNAGTAILAGASGSGAATISGNITLGSGGVAKDLTLQAAAGGLVISGVVSDAAGISGPGATLTFNSGLVKLTNNGNNFTGNLVVNGGTLCAYANNAFGTGTIIMYGGILSGPSYYTDTQNVSISNNVVWNGDFSPANSTGKAWTMTGTNFLTGNRTVSTNNVSVSINGPITDQGGNYGITFTSPDYGNGYNLGGSNTFSGGITVNGPRTGNGTVTVVANNPAALGTG